jgi:hypothetical protein
MTKVVMIGVIMGPHYSASPLCFSHSKPFLFIQWLSFFYPPLLFQYSEELATVRSRTESKFNKFHVKFNSCIKTDEKL